MSDIKSMKLYTHVQRIYRELGALGKTVDDPLGVDELSAFDQMHYHGTQALDLAMAMIGIDGEPRWLEIGSGLGGSARHIAACSDVHVTALSDFYSAVNRHFQSGKLGGLRLCARKPENAR